MIGVGASLSNVTDLDDKIGKAGYDIYFGLKNISKSCKDLTVSKVTDADGWLTISANTQYGTQFVSLVKAEWLFNTKFTEVIEAFFIFRNQSCNHLHESQLQVNCTNFIAFLKGSVLRAIATEREGIVDCNNFAKTMINPNKQ